MIFRRLVVGPFGSNCYLIGDEDGKEGMIIDPGDEAEKILSNVRNLGLTIKTIVLTHQHVDHIGALKEVQADTSAEVAVHESEMVTLPEHAVNIMFGISYPTPPTPDRPLKDGDTIDIGNLSFQVIHTPGHSPGCICLLNQGILFSGDTLFNYGIGRTDFEGGSFPQLMESIHTRLMILPDETVVFPGHGSETTIGTERRSNPFLSG